MYTKLKHLISVGNCLQDGYSSIIKEWNKLRSEVIELAYRKMLWPEIIKELRTQLLVEAKECVLKLCSQKLYNWLKVSVLLK